MEDLRQVIDEKIRPLLNAHGGDIELVELTEDGFAKVKLTGACATCPGPRQTMAEVVESAILEAVPSVKGVIPMQSVDEDLIKQALAILRKGKN